MVGIEIQRKTDVFRLLLANWKARLRRFLGCLDLRSFHRFASISNELVVNLNGFSRQVCFVITLGCFAQIIFSVASGGILLCTDRTKSSVAILE